MRLGIEIAGAISRVLAADHLSIAASISAYVRSPSSPCCVTTAAFSSSPIIDLTGYLHKDTTEPTVACSACVMALPFS